MTAQHDAARDTPAIQEVEASGIPFRVVRTERASSAEESAELQGIEVGQLIRSIVVRRGPGDYVFVLVPGGRQIDWARLRAQLRVRRLSLPDQEEARDATGYERGAITPFASSTAWPVVADAAIVDREVVAIGAGAHGVNLHLNPTDLLRVLGAEVADVSDPRSSA
jgi:Cys-tRNA(Pro) deacylase